jgi:hypothetical protein
MVIGKNLVTFHVYWAAWDFGKQVRLNGTLQWGWDPYTSYRVGPFEIRVYQQRLR